MELAVFRALQKPSLGVLAAREEGEGKTHGWPTALTGIPYSPGQKGERETSFWGKDSVKRVGLFSPNRSQAGQRNTVNMRLPPPIT